jgi:hypothetical protein
VKSRYEAARNINSLLTCNVIDTAYTYPADDGTTGLTAGAPVVPIIHTSRTYWYPCMSGAIIDHDGKLSQPNFNPEGFLKTASRLLNT